jgi:rhamnopyranosyl-N-acetylglucosaminyl-diphospho-decaprenol beta-1,3/1,4-galactofuranosyltransferase
MAPPLMIVAVVVTRNRPKLLRRCLESVIAQVRAPDLTFVIDNASNDLAAADIAAQLDQIRCVRLEENIGGAGGFRLGIALALQAGADAVWLMDDDGYPADAHCLPELMTAMAAGCDIAAPLVMDVQEQSSLAFPLRLSRRTCFQVEEVTATLRIDGFAHLFNGALIKAAAFSTVGLPDPRFVIRGDEVEFLYRCLRAGLRVGIHTAARFLHPGSAPEIHPIMFGLFYAVVPESELKSYYQFRNRGYIFRAYGMWIYLAADVVRYGWFYIISSGLDLRGFLRWLGATATGWRGQFMQVSHGAETSLIPQILVEAERNHANG